MVTQFAQLSVICNCNLISSKYTVMPSRPHWPVYRICPWYFEILSTLHFRSKEELWGTLGMSNMLSYLWKTDHHRVNQCCIPYHAIESTAKQNAGITFAYSTVLHPPFPSCFAGMSHCICWTQSSMVGYSTLLKTGSLDNAIRLFSLA